MTLHCGDCREVMAAMEAASVDAVVTDPPYGLEFMGREWDSFKGDAWRTGAGMSKPGIGDRPTAWPAFGGSDSANATCATCGGRMRGARKCACPEPDWRVKGRPLSERDNRAPQMRAYQEWCTAWAAECLRVLKPGGHLVAFGGTRTYHRLACAIEDAGFEIRDSLHWIYGSGFPKSRDVSKAIDRTAGAEREVTAHKPIAYPDSDTWGIPNSSGIGNNKSMFGVGAVEKGGTRPVTAPATEDAARWEGWGTALKPSHEPVIVAQKPAGQSDILVEIGSRLDQLEITWQVQDVAPATPTGKVAGSSAATGTPPSGWTAETCSNIVTSWRRCWADLCELTSTSTTATTSSTTTGLRTLSSCLGRLTEASTRGNASLTAGQRSLVSAVDDLFAAAMLNLRATLALSADATATSSTPISPLDAADPDSPAHEPIVLARKPLAASVAANVLEHGTGALNINGCRVDSPVLDSERRTSIAGTGCNNGIYNAQGWSRQVEAERGERHNPAGRWPPNVLLGPEAAAELDAQSGTLHSQDPRTRAHGGAGKFANQGAGNGWRTKRGPEGWYGDTGGASRFFPVFKYQAKAPASERPRLPDGTTWPTVKPLGLMRWLVKLVTPPGGRVLDPFAGTGTTGEACALEGFDCVLIEQDPKAVELARIRLGKPVQPTMGV